MTDGTKKVLIVGGVAVAAYFGWKYVTSMQATATDSRVPYGATNVRVTSGSIGNTSVTQFSYQPTTPTGTVATDEVTSYRRS